MKATFNYSLSRRSFLTQAAVGLGGAAVFSILPAETQALEIISTSDALNPKMNFTVYDGYPEPNTSDEANSYSPPKSYHKNTEAIEYLW